MRAALVRITWSVMLVTAATFLLATPVGARESVDPTTLNPPPPDFFNATCERIGRGIVCDLAFSDPPFADEPSGIVCGTTEILVSQTRSVVGKRFYDADGNLLRRHFREDFAGTLTNPSTGQTLAWIGQDTVIHVLAVPGDDTTGQLTVSGTPTRVFVPHGPTILVDAGRLVIDVATDEVIHSAGPHHFDDYFVRGDVDALQSLCEALA
jgi:hypothetical protein